ncbi:unnamed protein product, partial [Clonostachys solani]
IILAFRQRLYAAVMVLKPGDCKLPAHFKLADASIPNLLQGLESGQFTTEQLVKTYVARIHDVQPKVHAVSEINPDCVALALELDKERAQGQTRGLLHGLPILLKDVFGGHGVMNTTVGFSGLAGAKYSSEATVLRRLRDAGAVVHAHTSMTEWLNIRASKNAPNGWSPVSGQSLGIFCQNQDPGGSSTGSGIGAALGLGAAALGTETAGSIASPARTCGVVGLKPTATLVSRQGIFMGSQWQDSVGILARSVLDAAYVLTAISGEFEAAAFGTRNFAKIQGLMDYVLLHVINTKPFVGEKFEEALDVLQSLGAVIVDDATFPEYSLDVLEKYKDIWNVSLMVDFRNMADMNNFLGTLVENPHGLNSIEDVIEYTKRVADEKFEAHGADDLELASQLGRECDINPQAYEESRSLRLRMGMEIGKLLDNYNCSLLVTPSWTDTTASLGGNPQISLPLPALPEDFPVKLRGNGMVADGPNIP